MSPWRGEGDNLGCLAEERGMGIADRTWAWITSPWSPRPSSATRRGGSVPVTHPSHPWDQEALSSRSGSGSLPWPQIAQACCSPQEPRNTQAALGSQLPSSSFPHSVQIKATALYPSFVNSIFVRSSPGSRVVCSWTAFWEAFLRPRWVSAMGLEELQSHRMPRRERNERQEENRGAALLSWPVLPAWWPSQSASALFRAVKSCATGQKRTGQRLTVLWTETKEWGWI